MESFRQRPDNWRSGRIHRRPEPKPFHRRISLLIARTWFAAARPGRPRGADGAPAPTPTPRTLATRGSNGARIARDNVAGRSRARDARGTARSRSRVVAAAKAATRRSRRTAARRRRESRPTSVGPTAVPSSSSMRRTPCRPPTRNWRGRVAALPRPAPITIKRLLHQM